MTDLNRLPISLIPEHYDLTVRTEIAEKRFSGSVVISLRVDEDASEIVLNAHEMLQITSASFAVEGLVTAFETSAILQDVKNERLTLNLPVKAAFGPGLRGYYLSLSGAKPCGVTKFEPGAARRAFPCWDEPLLKAKFSVTHYTRDEDCVSNMPLERHDVVDGWRVHRFASTPPMSTYLVAWVVGPLQTLASSVLSMSGKDIPLRVICPAAHDVKECEFTLRLMEQVLPIYEKLFDVPYLLPKLDIVVVDDFESYAMENWGMITGRPERLLVNVQSMSLGDRKDAVGTVTHEIAHMWFGDAVSFNWWDQLWLSEAFATLVGELIIPNRINPEWNLPQEFVVTHLRSGLALDSRRGSHPVQVHCPSVNDISQYYDDISYAKGAAILRMLSAVVGEDVFIEGTSTYLKSHLFGNAETKDLWKAISAHTSVDVVALMDNWTCKTGYPVLFVREKGTKLHVYQKRFFATGAEEDGTIWTIPLLLKIYTDDGVIVEHRLLDQHQDLVNLGPNYGFKVNAGSVGFYRVAYEPARLKILAASKMSVEDRIGIVSDAWALSRAGIYAVPDVLDMLKGYSNEDSPHVWAAIRLGLDKMMDVWWDEPEDVQIALRSLILELFRPIATRNYSGTEVQVSAIKTCARAGDQSVIKRLEAMFNTDTPADLEAIVHETAVKGGRFEDVRRGFETSKSTKRNNALRGLCAATTAKDQDAVFNMITDSTIKDQDVVEIFIGLSANHTCRRRLAAYFKSNFDDLSLRFANNFGFGQLITLAFDTLTSPNDLAETGAFFADRDMTANAAQVERLLDFMKASVQWLERDRERVKDWAAARTARTPLADSPSA